MSETLHVAQKDRGAVRIGGPITFKRVLAVARKVPLIMMLALCGCATARPVTQPPAATALAGGGDATVAAVRPVLAFVSTGVDPRAALLAAMGVSAAGGRAPEEIVIRTDGGETLSVVQANTANLAPGERVEVVPGDLPRLVPAAPAS